MTCMGCGAPMNPPPNLIVRPGDTVRCSECRGWQIWEDNEMSASNEHQHACIRCGDLFACWCTNPLEVEFQRMCHKCAEQHARIKDAHWPRSAHFRRPNDFRRR